MNSVEYHRKLVRTYIQYVLMFHFISVNVVLLMYAVFDLTTNYETRQGYDRIMEVKKVKDLSDSVSVVHS